MQFTLLYKAVQGLLIYQVTTVSWCSVDDIKENSKGILISVTNLQ